MIGIAAGCLSQQTVNWKFLYGGNGPGAGERAAKRIWTTTSETEGGGGLIEKITGSHALRTPVLGLPDSDGRWVFRHEFSGISIRFEVPSFDLPDGHS